MPAAISPSDASRSRSRSRSSICSTCVRSLKNTTAPIDRAVFVAHLRKGVADDPVEVLQAKLRAVRQVVSSKTPDSARTSSGLWRNSSRERLADIVGAARERKDPVGLVVHQREGAVAVNGDHAVPHAAHEVTEEPVVGTRAIASRVEALRLRGIASVCGRVAGILLSLGPLAQGVCPRQKPAAAAKSGVIMAVCAGRRSLSASKTVIE